MKLIVGLGNPGTTYAGTRHNLGFRAVTQLAQGCRLSLRHSLRFKAKVGRGRIEGEESVLFLPETFMNRSGESVGRWVAAERMLLEDMLVVLDDLHLPLGRLRIRASGSGGGHQGLQSIIEAVGSGSFPRLRLGIGAPKDQTAWEEYVLRPFRRDEEPRVSAMVGQAADCCRFWIVKGTHACANRFHVKDKTDDTV